MFIESQENLNVHADRCESKLTDPWHQYSMNSASAAYGLDTTNLRRHTGRDRVANSTCDPLRAARMFYCYFPRLACGS